MLTPSEIILNFSGSGPSKTQGPFYKTFLLGVLGGAITAFGGAISNVVAHGFDNVTIMRISAGIFFAFTIGLVIILGGQLFTGNGLLILPVLDRRISARAAARNLATVYVGNGTGAFLIAAACAYSGHFDMGGGALAVYTIGVALGKSTLPFANALTLGILCNLLICVGVLVSSAARDVPGRVLGAFLPVAIFVTCGFENTVANMYYIPAGLLALANPAYREGAVLAGLDIAGLDWGGLLHNLIPVSAGNLLAGLLLGALLWVCYRDRQVPANA